MPETPDQELERLQKEVSGWVEYSLRQHTPSKVRDLKVVRDAVHGFLSLQPHEVAIIDTPIFQRLRYIHQTALAT